MHVYFSQIILHYFKDRIFIQNHRWDDLHGMIMAHLILIYKLVLFLVNGIKFVTLHPIIM